MSGILEHWPNRITVLRFIGSVILFVLFAVYGENPVEETRVVWRIAFWLFVLTALTDYLDGYLARRDGLESNFGRIADTFTDKILILGALIFMAVMPWSKTWVPAWLVVLVLGRELLVTGIRSYVERSGAAFYSDWFGKIKMVVQCVFVGTVIFIQGYDWSPGWASFWNVFAWVLFAITLVTTVGSGMNYVLKSRQIFAGSES